MGVRTAAESGALVDHPAVRQARRCPAARGVAAWPGRRRSPGSRSGPDGGGKLDAGQAAIHGDDLSGDP
jgi:hypothetical protein